MSGMEEFSKVGDGIKKMNKLRNVNSYGVIWLQMEVEQVSLIGEKDVFEMEKIGIKEELVRVEQEKMDFDIEKMGKCRKVISGRYVKGGYILDIVKMSRCIKVIDSWYVGWGGGLYIRY